MILIVYIKGYLCNARFKALMIKLFQAITKNTLPDE